MKKIMELLGWAVALVLIVEVMYYGFVSYGCKLMNDENIPGTTVVVERQGFLDYDVVVHQEQLFGLYEKEDRYDMDIITVLTGYQDLGK